VSKFDEAANFCARMLGTDAKCPLKDQSGAVIGAVLDAYVKLTKPAAPPTERAPYRVIHAFAEEEPMVSRAAASED
jgi:hypothetical protein